MGRRDDETQEGGALHIRDHVWYFYRDAKSDCYVARRVGNEDQPHISTDLQHLRNKIKERYGQRAEDIYDD